MTKLRVTICLLLLICANLAQARAQTDAPTGLLVYNAWVRPTAPALADGATPPAPLPGTVAGAYLTIANTSSEDYQLVGISADLSQMAMLHESSVDDKGIARMRMVMTLDIPAGETVTFKPGGYHVMLTGISRDVYPGDTVGLTLALQDSSGASFDLPAAALALDFPPEDETLIVANALAQPDATDASALDVSLVLDNRGDADVLTGVSSDIGRKAAILSLTDGRVFPYSTLDIAAQAQTAFTSDGIFIRLSDLTEIPGEAFALTLTFASGKTLTVGVPVVDAETAS